MPTADTPDRDAPWTRLGQIVRRHRPLMALSIAVGMVLGAFYGLVGPGTYTAESRLLVGTFEAPAAAIPGYVLASQTVAGNYARLATSSAVFEKLPTDLSLSPDEIISMVSVTAIPDSAIVRVVATSGSANDARTASEAMASAIDATVAELNARGSGDDLLAEYRVAAEELAAATTELATAQAALDRAGDSSTPAAISAREAVDAATISVDAATLKAEGLATRYQTEQETVSTSSQVRVLGGAIVSSKSRVLNILTDAVVGAALGFVVGLGLAWRRDGLVTAGADDGEVWDDDTEQTEAAASR